MPKNRMEAFSDGVLAIIITIMVLELHMPDGATFDAIRAVIPTFIAYVLSYIYVGIYWNNHHHLVSTLSRVNTMVQFTLVILDVITTCSDKMVRDISF